MTPVYLDSGAKSTATVTFEVTFGEFGTPVSVTPPPASQVYELARGWSVGLGVLGPALPGPADFAGGR